MNCPATFKTTFTIAVLAVILILCGCSTDKDKFAEFEKEYDPAIQELLSLAKDAEVINQQNHTQKSSYFISKCDSVSGKTRERALVMQERANAIKDDKARKMSITIASDFEKAGSAARELGAAYNMDIQALRGVVNPEDNILRFFYGSISKLVELTDLIEKIETSHGSLKDIIARK